MTTTTDPTFEDEVRAMLARRAADVPDAVAGEVPPLPTGLRIPILPERRPPSRARVLAVAAVVALAAGAAAVLGGETRPGHEAATAPTPPATTVEPGSGPASTRPEHLASLPLGVDPTVEPIRTIESWGATPEAAAEDLMGEARLGLDRVSAFTPLSWEGVDPDGLWAARWSLVAPLDPDAWPRQHADGAEGTVTVRRTDTGWTTVAATSAVLDLTAVRYDATDGGLRGEVRAAVPAPVQVTLSSLAGDVLATSDLTTDAAHPRGPSVLSLDDLLEATDGQPLLLRVVVGDRPGQVGLDGVEVAGFASVVLPGWAEGGDVPSTTLLPAPSSGDPPGDPAAALAGLLPPGVDPRSLTPLPVAADATFDGAPVDPEDPLQVAHAFLDQRLPSSPGVIRWAIDPDLVAIEWWPGDGEGPDLGEGWGTIVVRRGEAGWEVVAALSRAFDLRGVRIDGGWPTGEVRRTGPGDWWTAVVTGPGFTADEVESIVDYVRSLDAAVDPVPGALPAPPADRGGAPATLYAAMASADGAAPFVEIALSG